MMAGPLVGGDRGIGWVRAIVGAFVVCLVVQYLVGKLLPEVLASIIAWGAFALVMVAVWRINSRAGRNELLGSARFGSRDDVRGLESGDGDLLPAVAFPPWPPPKPPLWPWSSSPRRCSTSSSESSG